MSKSSFHEVSYDLHKQGFGDESPEEKFFETWFDETTVDYWRHMRMMQPAFPLLKWKKWVTIGDGRWGLDSIRLKKANPNIKILPTDLAENLLKKSLERGLIDDYSVENAEALSFNDDQFDVSFCKESYHHFPRPFLALYEMLRVSRKAVVLSEPNDYFPIPPLRKFIESVLVGLKLRKPFVEAKFETVGNYVYSISKREIEKAAISIQLPLVAFHEHDDSYIEGVEFEKLAENGPMQKKIKRSLWLKAIQAKLGLRRPGTLLAILFKVMPDEEMRRKLKENGFTLKYTPKNPYVSIPEVVRGKVTATVMTLAHCVEDFGSIAALI